MTCDECRTRLQELVDRELPPADRASLEAHLAVCPECSSVHRKLASFTTKMVKVVQPLQPSKDFSSKVMAKYSESKATLPALPPAPPPAVPRSNRLAWPFLAGSVVAVAAGLTILFWSSGGVELARLGRGAESVKVHTYANGNWREQAGRRGVSGGERVSVLQPGDVAELDFAPLSAGWVLLQGLAQTQLERQGEALVLRPLPESPGRYFIRTSRSVAPQEVRLVRVVFGRVRVEVTCGEDNGVEVNCAERGDLVVSVRNGYAVVANLSDRQTLAEGSQRTVPQNGPCGLPVQTPEGAFTWIERK